MNSRIEYPGGRLSLDSKKRIKIHKGRDECRGSRAGRSELSGFRRISLDNSPCANPPRREPIFFLAPIRLEGQPTMADAKTK